MSAIVMSAPSFALPALSGSNVPPGRGLGSAMSDGLGRDGHEFDRSHRGKVLPHSRSDLDGVDERAVGNRRRVIFRQRGREVLQDGHESAPIVAVLDRLVCETK